MYIAQGRFCYLEKLTTENDYDYHKKRRLGSLF